MLQNAYLVAKTGADTAENERNVAKKLQKKWQLSYPCASRDGAPSPPTMPYLPTIPRRVPLGGGRAHPRAGELLYLGSE